MRWGERPVVVFPGFSPELGEKWDLSFSPTPTSQVLGLPPEITKTQFNLSDTQ